MFTHAITRKPGKNFAQGITTTDPGTPSYKLILKQHGAYIQTLKSLGLEVIVLDPEPDYPDAYFVEDTAVVTPDVAVITNPGAKDRQGEENTIEPILSKHRKTIRIQPPGTLDGGDVLMVDTHFFIGISKRSNREGAEQLGRILEKYGNSWSSIPVDTGLHLKSFVNFVGNNTLIVTKDFADLNEFMKFDKIIINKEEGPAANTLLINDCLIIPKGFSDTRKKLATLGLNIIELDVSEARKMDGGLTCMSIRF
jgi:dimethylargininase